MLALAPVDRWTKIAHAAVVVVLILGPLLVAWGLISRRLAEQVEEEALCARLGCDGPLFLGELLLPFVAIMLAFGATIWIGALIWHISLVLGEQTRARLTGLALTDACWIAAAALGLQAAAGFGGTADDARLFAWALIVVAGVDIVVCVLRVVVLSRVAGARLAT